MVWGCVDLVLLSCKVYDLEDVIMVICFVVGECMVVLLVFNGLVYLEWLDVVFGELWVFGGLCYISVMSVLDGVVLYLSNG